MPKRRERYTKGTRQNSKRTKSTSEGYSFWPSISPDGKKLYYLVRTGGPQNFMKGGLWVADLDSGQRQRLLPDFEMRRVLGKLG